MITPRQAVLAAAATYGGAPTFRQFGGAVSMFVTTIDGATAIAIEGTHDSFGWALDFDAWPAAANETVAHPTLPPMHRGFRDATLSVLPAVRLAIAGKPWAAIGHSLGGAVALTLAAWLADEGTPPVGAFLFAPARVFLDAPDVLAGVPIFGWRCGGDIVPMAPPWCWRPLLTHFDGPADEASHAIGNFLGFIR
jgi:hypothetical protein